MVEIKNCIWMFPLTGSFIVIISFLTPAATFVYQESSIYSEFYRWMLDFYVAFDYIDGNLTATRIGFNTSFTGYFSLTLSSLIIVFTIILLIPLITYKNGALSTKIKWLIFPILTVILTITWIVMKEISTILSFNHSFWGLLRPGFGIIGLFLGAGMQLIGYIFLKKNTKER